MLYTLIVAHKQPIILLQKLEDKTIKETISTIILMCLPYPDVWMCAQ